MDGVYANSPRLALRAVIDIVVATPLAPTICSILLRSGQLGGCVEVPVASTTLDMSVSMEMASDTIERKNNAALHFNHHPIGIDIYHWTTIRGYSSSGATLDFQDSSANTTVLGPDWDLVAPYFSMSSSKTYNLMAANGIASRGIAW